MRDVVNALIQERLGQIVELCRRHSVHRLGVFGSAVRANFDPLRSNLDFLVDFEPMPPAPHAEPTSATLPISRCCSAGRSTLSSPVPSETRTAVARSRRHKSSSMPRDLRANQFDMAETW